MVDSAFFAHANSLDATLTALRRRALSENDKELYSACELMYRMLMILEKELEKTDDK